MVLFLRFSPLPFGLRIDREVAGRLLRFGLPLAGASIVVFAISFADQIVAGRVLGPTALGFYLLAFNLSSWPVQMFSQPLRAVAPPTFARLQHQPEAMRSAFRSILGLLAAVTFPVCLLLAGAAAPLIRFVYGRDWEPAADALVWLGVLAAFRILFELAYDYLVVIGVSRAIFLLQVVTLAALIPALIVGAHAFGIAGVAAAQVLVADERRAAAVPRGSSAARGCRCGKVLARLWLPVLIAAGVFGCRVDAGDGRALGHRRARARRRWSRCVALASMVYRDRAELDAAARVRAGGRRGRHARAGRDVSVPARGRRRALARNDAALDELIATARHHLARGRLGRGGDGRPDRRPARVDQPHRALRQPGAGGAAGRARRARRAGAGAGRRAARGPARRAARRHPGLPDRRLDARDRVLAGAGHGAPAAPLHHAPGADARRRPSWSTRSATGSCASTPRAAG